MYKLSTPLTQVIGFGQKTVATLTKRDIITVGDLLLTLPIRYEDRRQLLTIEQLKNQISEDNISDDQLPTILATVDQVTTFYKGGRSIQRAVIFDHTGKLNLSWFNSPFIMRTLKKNCQYYFSGKYQAQYRSLTQPSVEIPKATAALHTGRLVPIYSSTLGVKPGTLRRRQRHILDQLELIPDPQGTSINHIFEHLHFPDQIGEIEIAHRRLSLEELLCLIKQAEIFKRHLEKRRASWRLSPTGYDLQPTLDQLPFQLTTAQKKALSEILSDLQKAHPAKRMLQGDVGSGKTIVAAIAAQALIHSGSSVCLVAPTRVLAQQHQETISTLLPNLPIQIVLGGTKNNRLTHEAGDPKLYIGTQALLNQIDSINPGLVIYDEQHRFGVKQRSQVSPHILTMTATPIPRSLMLSVFSHLDLSIIDELPLGRKPIKTWVVPKQKRFKALEWIKKDTLSTNGLALIVCPIIDPSETTALENVQAATSLFEELKPHFEPEIKLGLIHGRMKKPEQEKIIADVRCGTYQALVSTSIIEVGVDLPAASIMMIEAAERFGLASLHQLRGRIGRRNQQAYCLVFTNSQENTILNRLNQFSKISNGQKLAELDLKNRGAGELFGLEQHGFGGLRYASWADLSLIKQAQDLSLTLPKNWQSSIFPDLESPLPVSLT